MTHSVNGTIDFFKFIFAITIVVHHAGMFFFINEVNLCPTGFMIVEFYFIVAGYFMFKNAIAQDATKLGYKTFLYLKRKYFNLFPFLFVSLCMGFLVTSAANHDSLPTALRNLIHAYPDLFLLQMLGYSGVWVTGISWYLSAMFLAIAVLFPLCIRYKHALTYFVFPLSILILYGYVIKISGNLNQPDFWFGAFYKGTVRALNGVALGCIAYRVSERLQKLSLRRLGKIIITAVELGSYLMVILLAFKWQTNYTDLLFVFLLFVAVCISFSNQSALSFLLNQQNTSFYRSASVSIYFSHFFWASNLNRFLFFQNKSDFTKLMLYFALAGISSVLNYGSARFLIKHNPLKMLKRWMVV